MTIIKILNRLDKLVFFYPAVLLTISGLIFSIIIIQKQPDLNDHIDNAIALINGKPLVGNFLFYFIIGLMAFWQPIKTWVLINAVVVLCLAVLAKYYISLKYLKDGLTERSGVLKISSFLAFALCLVMNLPNRPSFTWLIGQFSPNLWHNSTTIFLMPVALIIFFESVKFVENEKDNLKRVLYISVLVLLSLLIKPSFYFVFGPAFGFLCLLKFRLNPKFWMGLIPIITGLFLLILQTLQIYFFYPYHQDAGFRIDPFFVWNNWSYFIPISIIASIAFPMGVAIVFFNDLKQVFEFQFSWLMLLIGLIIYSLMAENGPFWIQVSNNFGWQLYIINFILFLISTKYLYKRTIEVAIVPKIYKLLWIVFAAHFMVGILYLIKTPIFGYR
jgi:hypothetical protein